MEDFDIADSFWWARGGSTQMRVLESLCSCAIQDSSAPDAVLVDLYRRIRTDKFGSIQNIATNALASQYVEALDSALERYKEDEDEMIYHARGVVSQLKTIANRETTTE